MQEFEREFKSIRKTVMSLIMFYGILVLAILAGIAWVVFQLLKYFGVIQ